jgi:hypothetical protein
MRRDAVALCFSEPNGSPIPRNIGFDRKIEYLDLAMSEVKGVASLLAIRLRAIRRDAPRSGITSLRMAC